MADEVDFLVRIEANIEALRSELNTAGASIQRLGTQATTSGGMIKNALSFAGGLGIQAILSKIGEGFLEAGKMGWEFNSSMQQNLASFTTLLGGSEVAAQKMVDTLTKMAAATPFETTDLTKAASTLMGFGIEASKVEKTLKMLGDVSQGNKERFNSLTLAFSQVSAAGKMTGQDLLQMINAGFNPLQTMAKTTGKSLARLKEDMEKGAISAKMVESAFVTATSKGGLFYGAMDKQSKTFAGQMSTLSDNIKQTLGKIMIPLFEKISNDILPKVIIKVEEFSKVFQKTGSIIEATGTIIGASREDINLLKQSLEDISTVASDLYEVFKVVWPLMRETLEINTKVMVVTIKLLSNTLKNYSDFMTGVFTFDSNKTWNAVATQFGIKANEIKKSVVKMGEGINSGLVSSVKQANMKTSTLLGGIVTEAKKTTSEVSTASVETGKKISDVLEKAASKAKESADKLTANVLYGLNKMNEATIVALKNKYAKEENLQVTSLEKQSTNLREQTDYNIKQYEREYLAKSKSIDDLSESEVKAIQDKIDAIENLSKAEEARKKEIDFTNELSTLQSKAKILKDFPTERIEVEKQINELIAQHSKDFAENQKEAKKQELQNEIDQIRKSSLLKKAELEKAAEIKKQTLLNEQAMVETNISAEISAVKLKYSNLSAEDALQATARYLALDQSNNDLITLLETYNPKWQDAGQSFGQSLIEGINSTKAGIQDTISSVMSMLGPLKSAQENVIKTAGIAWNAANRSGDTDAMAAAHAMANEARSALGIPTYASGTNFASGGISLVGERGPELVNLPRGSQVTPNSALGGIVINVGTLVGSGGMNEFVNIISNKLNKKYSAAIGGGFY